MKPVIFFLFVVFIGITSCQPKQTVPADESQTAGSELADSAALVKRGEYLVNAIGCDDCHSPKIMGQNGPEPDMSRRLSGHPAELQLTKIDTSILRDWYYFGSQLTAAVGPWGVSFSANLTPDPTGLMTMTEAQFFKVIREGKYKGLDASRPILPPMPWFSIAKLNDEDIRSIYYFLRTIPAVSNVVPAPMTLKEISI